jgi:hypothetical protein
VERIVPTNFEYKPSGWIEIKGIKYPIGYKVTDIQNRSLGLRQNPNILTFPINEWLILPLDKTFAGRGDWGGIWSALRRSGATTLRKYMLEKYDTETKIYLSAIYKPIYANSYRVKSQGIILLEELR